MSRSIRDVVANVWINDKTGGKTLRELRAESKKLNNEMANLSRNSEEFRQKAKRLREVQAGMKQIRQETAGVGDSWGKMADKFNRYAGMLAATAAVLTGVVVSLKNFVEGSAELADAQSDVAKTTGLTTVQVEELTQRLGNFNTRSSRLELLALAEEAGRLGKETIPEIEDFVRVADQLRVALGDDLGGDEAIREVGKLTEIYRVGEREGTGFGESMLKLGSAINEVSASGSNQASFLVDYLKRMAGVSSQTTLTAEDTIGYAAAFDELGQSQETTATAMSQLVTNMFKDTSTYASIAGVDVGEFSELLKTDTNQAMLLFLQGLNGNNEGMQVMAQKFEALGVDGTRAIAAISALSGNLDLLKERQYQANEALEEGTSLTNEFNVKNQNLAANLQKITRALYGKFVSSEAMKSLEDLFGWMAKIVEVPLSATMEEDRIKMRALGEQALSTNISQERRNEIINELMERYPDYLGALDKDKVSNEELEKALKNANDQMVNRILLQEQDEKIQNQAQVAAKKKRAELEAEDKLLKAIVKAEELSGKQSDRNLDLSERGYQLAVQMENKWSQLGAKNKLMDSTDEYRKAVSAAAQSEGELNSSFTEKEQLIARLGIQTEKAAEVVIESNDKVVESEQFVTDSQKKELEKRQKDLEKLEEDRKKALIEFYQSINDAGHAQAEAQSELAEFAIRSGAENERAAALEKYEQGLTDWEAYQVERNEIEISTIVALIDAKRELGQDTLELEEELAEMHNAVKEKAVADEKKLLEESKKMREEQMRSTEASYAAGAQIFELMDSSQEGFVGQLEQAGQAYINHIRKVIKGLAMQAAAQQIANVLATVPFPINVLLASTAGFAASLLFDRLLPASSFDKGGYTSVGLGVPDPKLPGRYITGYVHDNEYVVATEEMRRPDIAGMVGYIEQSRRRRLGGFDQGGFTSTSTETASAPRVPSDGQATMRFDKMESILTSILEELRKPKPVAIGDSEIRKISSLQSRDNQTLQRSSINR